MALLQDVVAERQPICAATRAPNGESQCIGSEATELGQTHGKELADDRSGFRGAQPSPAELPDIPPRIAGEAVEQRGVHGFLRLPKVGMRNNVAAAADQRDARDA